MKDNLSKIAKSIFGTRAAGLYMLFFAISIGVATFIENDYGTSSAQKVVYKAFWFEVLLTLFSITLIYNIVRFRMIQQKKWALLLFHSAIIIIIIGSAVTRYYGYEGMMHIRENDSSDRFLSADTYLQYEVITENNKYQFDEPVLFASLGSKDFTDSYQIGNKLINLDILDFIPNPKQVIESSDTGLPMLKIVFGGAAGREEFFISKGQAKTFMGTRFNFTTSYDPSAINIQFENRKLLIKSDRPLIQRVMATQQVDTLYPSDQYYPLMLRSLYTDGDSRFVFGDFNEQGTVDIISEDQKLKNESMAAILMKVNVNGQEKLTYLYGKKGQLGNPSILRFDDLSMAISYGSKYVDLPFSIALKEFIMERYPGTNSAASYASEVQLRDSRESLVKDYRIYMNHILDHDGYRFFQSSFDKDEKGTYLSVNYDFAGTWISYIGYALLTIGMIMIFFETSSRFRKVSKKLTQLSTPLSLTLVMLLGSNLASGQKVIDLSPPAVSSVHAELFSKVVVQDHKGRMKPMHTMSREVMRKMSRSESLYGLSADQIILSMYADKANWLSIPMIKISEHEQLKNILGINGKLAAYKDFFNKSGAYKLRDEVRNAYGLQPIDRGTFEKDIMKIDERVNIASMIYAGRLFKIIPVIGDINNSWVSAEVEHGSQQAKSPVAEKFFNTYQPSLQSALSNSNYQLPNQIISELITYQATNGGDIMPSKTAIQTEILLNKLNPFNRLSFFYSILGFAFLILLFVSIFRPEAKVKKVAKILLLLLIGGFVIHTIGLGMRWYVSGRAPWSNGYESMIYIAWTTTLAGLIFTRKSLGGLAATMILAGTILLVAMLSYLDPEITPLVPVLKSYWLTIHVSLIAGSYGFLMLGAIIGFINLLLMVFLTKENELRIKQIIQEMTYISEMTLMGGLVMISIGTYLGGVWANESWGRYWGWDAKETWALVTILVYAFILHMRIMPKMYSLYSFNLASLFGFASVVMTYFGVNYYLSGLHSYAAGDPVPIPSWVYYAVATACIISILAFWRKKRHI